MHAVSLGSLMYGDGKQFLSYSFRGIEIWNVKHANLFYLLPLSVPEEKVEVRTHIRPSHEKFKIQNRRRENTGRKASTFGEEKRRIQFLVIIILSW